MNRIKLFILSGLTLLTVVGAAVVPAVASADDAKTEVCTALGSDAACKDNGGDGSSITGVVTAVVNLLSMVVGIVAVIMIIIAGFRFVTSGGDSNAVSGARKTIIYAIVGLLVVLLSQAIVHFVLRKATAPNCGSGQVLNDSTDKCVNKKSGFIIPLPAYTFGDTYDGLN